MHTNMYPAYSKYTHCTMYTHTYIDTNMHIHTVQLHTVYIRTVMHIYTNIHTYVHTDTYIYTVWLHTSQHTCTCIHRHIPTFIRTCILMHMYIHIYIGVCIMHGYEYASYECFTTSQSMPKICQVLLLTEITSNCTLLIYEKVIFKCEAV